MTKLVGERVHTHRPIIQILQDSYHQLGIERGCTKKWMFGYLLPSAAVSSRDKAA